MSPGEALSRAIHQRLAADDALKDLIGENRIFDAPPRGAAFPFVAFGAGTVRPLDADAGLEHRLSINVWSREGGRRQAQAVLDALATALESLPQALEGHRLANVSVERMEISRERDGRTQLGVARVRAVTEAV